MEKALAQAGATAALAVVGAAALSSPELLQFAMLQSQQRAGLPVLAGVLQLPSPEARTAPQAVTRHVAAMPAAAVAAVVPAALTPAVAPVTAAAAEAGMAALISAAIDEVLGSDAAASIGPHDPLLSSGVNSTAAVAVTARLEAALGVALPPTLVFDFPTISDMSEYLASNYGAASEQDTAAAVAVAPEAHMADLVAAAIGEVLGSDAAASIGLHDPLLSSGVNFTAAVAVTGRLEAALGVALPPTLVFDFPTISDMSEYLASNYSATAEQAPAAAGAGEREAAVAGLVAAAVQELLGGAEGVPPSEPLMSAGLNSTMAVALTGRLEAALGAPLPPTLVFDYPTMDAIVGYLLESDLAPPAAAATATSGAAPAALQQSAAVPRVAAQAAGRAPAAAAVAAVAPARPAQELVLIAATAHRVPGGTLSQPAQGELLLVRCLCRAIKTGRQHSSLTAV